MTNCSRCKGTGFFRASAGVAHNGVPGLCYGCDGAGTREAQIAKIEAEKAKAQKEIEYRSILLNEQKIIALAAYDAFEMGYISERKRNRRIESAKLECRSIGITDEEFKAYRVTDEVAIKLATEAMA
jgi:hypothetical protein